MIPLCNGLFICRYEINITDAALNFTAHKNFVSDVFPGRLFTTRMPRNVSTNSESANSFRRLAKNNKLATVVILTENFEYDIYAGDDLESFYRTIPGLKMHLHPIVDFSIPKREEFLTLARVCVSLSYLLFLIVTCDKNNLHV